MPGRRQSTSSDTSDRSRGASKVSKSSHGQAAPTVVKQRRAARACDRCRGSKLRCEVTEREARCALCIKADAECRFSIPAAPAPPLASSAAPPSRAASHVGVEGGERLAALESNVAKLLQMMESRIARPASQADIGQGTYRDHPTPAAAKETAAPMYLPPHLQAHMDVLSGMMPPSRLTGSTPVRQVEDWMTTPAGMGIMGSSDTGAGMSADEGASHGANAQVMGGIFDQYLPENAAHQILGPSPTALASASASLSATGPSASTAPRVQFAPPVHPVSASPLGSADTRRTPRSQHDAHAGEEAYNPAQARPIPKYGGASRIAALNDPTAHEAPFRSLTYNPDTYRNIEMDEDDRPLGMGLGTGGKTPKRGRGDPIDRGVLTEDEARALFQFYQEEIAFFIPILQEPATFDFIRHRSSYLLTTIIAIAAKYCCATTKRPNDVNTNGQAFLGTSPSAHAVKPLDERAWLQIRALAMSSYFQALISKVHCLEDVQATLLLAAWGLEDRGASSDPWILTGSAYRLARRLGIHTAAAQLAAGAQPTARLVASWKTFLCLYAFDRFFTVGFGRPETEGLMPPTNAIDIIALTNTPNFGVLCSPQSAACVTAYVELANLAKRFSAFVGGALKTDPAACMGHLVAIGAELDGFASRWLWARSPLAGKLGRSGRPVKMLYNHIRLCLHAVPLKPASHPDSESFLFRIGMGNVAGQEFLARCLKKAQDSASRIIQDFSDDMQDDNDTVMCYAYDYVFMVLSHASALLLNLSRVGVCGLSPLPLASSSSGNPAHSYAQQPLVHSPASSGALGAGGSIDRNTAMRYCGMAITGMVESNRSANFFPLDMAGNLSLIAKETGMVLLDWASEGVVRRLEERAAENEGVASALAVAETDLSGGLGMDFNLFTDLDFFLQPAFFDEGSAFL